MYTEHPGESNFNLCTGERRSKPQTGRIDHALIRPCVLHVGVRTGMGKGPNGTQPYPMPPVPLHLSLECAVLMRWPMMMAHHSTLLLYSSSAARPHSPRDIYGTY